jgi:isopenicillin-N N-acyltransferase like protein
LSELRVVRAHGDPATRGRQIGRELGDMIERSLAFYNRYFESRGVGTEELRGLLTPYLAASQARLPRVMATVEAMAQGAYVPLAQLFAVNAFEELAPLLRQPEGAELFHELGEGHQASTGDTALPEEHTSEHCSTFTVTGLGYTLMGHNEQWLEGDRGNVAVVIEIPEGGGRATVSPTIVCCLPAVGMNEYGGAQGIQSMRAADERAGIPRVLVSRHSLEASDRLDAFRRAAIQGRAGGYAHVFAFPGGDSFSVETTATQESVLEGPGPHTNHYLDPRLAELGTAPSIASSARYGRLLQLIYEREPETPEAVMGILRDHENAPNAICLHADPAQGDESEAVLFSMVCDVENAKMWVALGNPCTTAYQEVDLSGVVQKVER